MAKPATQFSADGISLSWPLGRDGKPGTREVIELPPGRRSRRIRDRINEGSIVETDLPVTPVNPSLELREGRYQPLRQTRRLFAGGSKEALARLREPAGPVVRNVFVPAGEVEQRVTPTAVIEPAGEPEGRRPIPEAIIAEQEAAAAAAAAAEAEAPTFEERVADKVDNASLEELQAEARAAGVAYKEGAAEWDDKPTLASAILEAQDAIATEVANDATKVSPSA